jgi:hypothetical protein
MSFSSAGTRYRAIDGKLYGASYGIFMIIFLRFAAEAVVLTSLLREAVALASKCLCKDSKVLGGRRGSRELRDSSKRELDGSPNRRATRDSGSILFFCLFNYRRLFSWTRARRLELLLICSRLA